CIRFENGNQMTLVADAPNPVQRMGCREQFDTGRLVIVTSISNRRYPVVDEANQVVSAIATFDHRGDLSAVPMERGRSYTPQGVFSRPMSFLIFESFKVIDGKIKQVEATVLQVPYRMPPVGRPTEKRRWRQRPVSSRQDAGARQRPLAQRGAAELEQHADAALEEVEVELLGHGEIVAFREADPAAEKDHRDPDQDRQCAGEPAARRRR